MIEFKLNMENIIQGQVSPIDIHIINSGLGTCMRILASIEMPESIAILNGDLFINIERLGSGDTFPFPLQVQADKVGEFVIHLADISFHGPDTRVHTMNPLQLILNVLPYPNKLQDNPEWRIYLEEGDIRIHQWSRLNGTLINNTTREWKNVEVRSQSPGVLDIDPLLLETIKSGETKAFPLVIRPLSSGNSVPVILQLISSSGAVLHTEKTFLKVRPENDKAESTTIYQVTIQNAQGTVIGPRNQVEQHFDDGGADNGEEETTPKISD